MDLNSYFSWVLQVLLLQGQLERNVLISGLELQVLLMLLFECVKSSELISFLLSFVRLDFMIQFHCLGLTYFILRKKLSFRVLVDIMFIPIYEVNLCL